MLKVGYLVPFQVIIAFPESESYLVSICDTQLLALLPKRYATKSLRVGDISLGAVFSMSDRIILSQKSPHFFKRLLYSLLAPLTLDNSFKLGRVASVADASFVKVAVIPLRCEDPVPLALSHLRNLKDYTDSTVTLVKYSQDVPTYAVNALTPAPKDKVKKVIYLDVFEEAIIYVEKLTFLSFWGRRG